MYYTYFLKVNSAKYSSSVNRKCINLKYIYENKKNQNSFFRIFQRKYKNTILIFFVDHFSEYFKENIRTQFYFYFFLADSI